MFSLTFPRFFQFLFLVVFLSVTQTRSALQCLQFGEGSVTGDMCEDLCVLGLVEYKRCLYYENGKKVIEARWRGKPIILKSKLENFSSYEPLGILDYQVPAPVSVSRLLLS